MMRSGHVQRTILLIAGLLTLACGRQLGDAPSDGKAGTPITLVGDLQPLRDGFNAHHSVPRAVLLLSPT